MFYNLCKNNIIDNKIFFIEDNIEIYCQETLDLSPQNHIKTFFILDTFQKIGINDF